MRSLIISILSLYLIINVANCGSKAEWRSRTIYQVLTDRFWRDDDSTTACSNLGNYCGGTYKGLIKHLDYITGMGFDAIWISPIIDNTPGGYHGYWGRKWYETNSNFGTTQDLQDFITACHSKGVWVMIDVVQNHVGPVGTDYSSIDPFNAGSDYHPYCIISDQDFTNNQTAVEWCRLAGLPDLYQENSATRSKLVDWTKWLMNTFKPDGIRIDTVPEVHPDYWSVFAQTVGVYTIGEIFSGNVGYIANYQSPKGPLDATLNYPMFFMLKNVFQSGNSMYNIRNYYNSMGAFPDQSVLGNFVDNHDNPRFLYQNGNQPAFKAALAFSLTATGIPIVYYGDEQGYGGGPDPACREQLWTNLNPNFSIYQFIKAIIASRKQFQVWNQAQTERYVIDNLYAFTRGNLFIGLTNSYNTQSVSITYHPYPNNQRLCNIFASTDCVTVANGAFPLVLSNGETKIFAPVNGDGEYIVETFPEHEEIEFLSIDN